MTRGIKQASAPVATTADDEPKATLMSLADAAPTLRDQIAMQAPTAPAWWANVYMARTGGHSIDAQALATWAYEYADAMLAERAK